MPRRRPTAIGLLLLGILSAAATGCTYDPAHDYASERPWEPDQDDPLFPRFERRNDAALPHDGYRTDGLPPAFGVGP